MRSEDLTTLFEGPSTLPELPPPTTRQGTILTFDAETGENTVQVGSEVMVNLPVDAVGAVPLAANDVVQIDTRSPSWFIKGRVSDPGSGAVPTWPADIVTAQNVANQASADAAAAQAAADALQTDLDAAEAAVAAVEASLATLNTTTLPALQTALDAAEADVAAAQADLATLTGTTLPALQAEVDGILPITSTDISDDAITTPKLAAGAVTALKIAANTITAAEIAANAITASELAANAVVAGKIAAGTIVATDISAGAITTAKIAADAVTANEIAGGTITATEIAAGSVTGASLAADAIDGKTITGALFRTAASGQRVEIDVNYENEVRFYTGNPAETEPGRVESSTSGDLWVYGPGMSGANGAGIRLHPSLGLQTAEIIADQFLFNTETVVTAESPVILYDKTLGPGGSQINCMRFGFFSGNVSGASGIATITHGLGSTPTAVLLTGASYYVRAVATSSTTISVEFRNPSTDALVANGVAVTVHWLAVN